MYISDLADLFDPVRLFLKDQLIWFKLQRSTEPQPKDHAAGRDLACSVFKHLIVLQLYADRFCDLGLREPELFSALFQD